jgi:hypothetical protein
VSDFWDRQPWDGKGTRTLAVVVAVVVVVVQMNSTFMQERHLFISYND